MTTQIEQILNPKSIAVVGASENTGSSGYRFTHHLLDYGFQGRIFPVNPKSSEILGMKVYPSVRDIPEPVDYVICCIPAPAVPGMLDDCAQNGVKGVHLFSGRFSETGRLEDARLERTIFEKAKEHGIRLIGPNCMGLYYPGGGISFQDDLPHEPGSLGLFSESGGGAGFFVLMASLRGLRFSKAVSGGNAIDLNESDFLDYFSEDPETRVIAMYLEGVRDGRRFFNSLRKATSVKPTIILKGGRGKSGMAAAASHTAALAGSMKTWDTAVAQTGAISARSFDEMADLAVSFNYLSRIEGPRVGVSGGGGGHSVLGADECEEAGLEVIPFPSEIREELKKRGSSIWDWIGNPVDVSIVGGGGVSGNDLLKMMANSSSFDMLIAIINEHMPAGKEAIIRYHEEEVKGIALIKKESLKPLLAVVSDKSTGTQNHDYWRWTDLADVRTRLLDANIPVYPTTAAGSFISQKGH